MDCNSNFTKKHMLLIQEYIQLILWVQSQLKLWHWQTTSYSQHKAFEEIYGGLDDLFDELIENLQGSHRITFGEKNCKIDSLLDINEKDIVSFVEATIYKFEGLTALNSSKGIINIRDDILTQLEKLRYLLSLK